ncbi:hypothetical protein GP2_002_00140 [Gordonia paraffinivorans NBRC 108238]|uniref:Ribosomally synthesized peptide with SipW-like signal peptide n=1 Tax=Gordonia paraffinivorans NBRC 108238 TaxID=1223543 RepID=A0ABQ0IG09_9ACTN|nr:hypothetical protein GP2_002_00140 [Gordonia paraffinivorans NBRC 108238]
MRRIPWSPNVSRRVRALLSCGILLTTGTLGTTALWSTTAATTSGTFTTANIELRVNGTDAYTFTFPGSLLPGSTTAAVVNVQNVGSVAIRYNARVSSSDALGQAMQLKVTAGGSVSGSTCTAGTGLVADGVSITGADAAFATSRGPLAATSGVETLCLQLTLPMSAPGTLAGNTGKTVKFTFDATAA